MSQSNVVNLMPWDVLVRSSAQRGGLKAMLERDDADEAIRALSPLESYYSIKDVGPSDALPYLHVITKEQITALIDMEVWNRDRFEVEDLLIWLEAFRETGLERLQLASRCMDPETLALLFRRRLMIALIIEEDIEDPPDWVANPSPDIEPIIRTPDNRFFIAARSLDEIAELEGDGENLDEEERKAVLELVDDLYRDEDFEFISSILRMAEAGLSSDFEEYSYRFRNARLEDLGFPPINRALEIFTAVDVDEVLASEMTQERDSGELRLPALHVAAVSEGFFVELMQSVTDPILMRAIEAELVPLGNAVLVAERVEMNNLEGVADCLKLVRHYLELGLSAPSSESLQSASGIEVATRRLAEHDLKTLFRVGYTIAIKLKTRMRVIDRALLCESELELFDAASARRPVILDRFALEELLMAWDAARNIDVSVLSGDVLPPPEEQTLQLLVMSLAARILLEDVDELKAFSPSELQRLAQKARTMAFDTADIDQTVKQFEGVWQERVRVGLSELAIELAPLAGAKRIDPRFVSGLVREIH